MARTKRKATLQIEPNNLGGTDTQEIESDRLPQVMLTIEREAVLENPHHNLAIVIVKNKQGNEARIYLQLHQRANGAIEAEMSIYGKNNNKSVKRRAGFHKF